MFYLIDFGVHFGEPIAGSLKEKGRVFSIPSRSPNRNQRLLRFLDLLGCSAREALTPQKSESAERGVPTQRATGEPLDASFVSGINRAPSILIYCLFQRLTFRLPNLAPRPQALLSAHKIKAEITTGCPDVTTAASTLLYVRPGY